MRLLSHVNTKQLCEISEKRWTQEHKWLCDSLKFKAKQEKHCVLIYTSPLFTME